MTTKRQQAVSQALNLLAPMMPLEDVLVVRALVGRPHMRSLLAEKAVWLAAVSHVRHVYTDYDALLDDGYDRDSARHFVLDDINDVLERWQCRKRVDGTEDEELLDSMVGPAFAEPLPVMPDTPTVPATGRERKRRRR